MNVNTNFMTDLGSVSLLGPLESPRAPAGRGLDLGGHFIGCSVLS